MNEENINLINLLGKDAIIKNVNNTETTNVMCGEFTYNNTIIITYIIGNNLSNNTRVFTGKIVGLIEINDNNEKRFVVSDSELYGSYAAVKGALRNIVELKNAKLKCLNEKSAGVVIYQMKNGEPYYLVTYSKKNFAGFPKGHVEYGETDESAAIREAKEEAGVDVKLKSNFKSSINYMVYDAPTRKEVVFFLAEIEENENINIDTKEINKYEIVNYKQASAILNEELMNVLTEAKKYIENN